MEFITKWTRVKKSDPAQWSTRIYPTYKYTWMKKRNKKWVRENQKVREREKRKDEEIGAYIRNNMFHILSGIIKF